MNFMPPPNAAACRIYVAVGHSGRNRCKRRQRRRQFAVRRNETLCTHYFINKYRILTSLHNDHHVCQARTHSTAHTSMSCECDGIVFCACGCHVHVVHLYVVCGHTRLHTALVRAHSTATTKIGAPDRIRFRYCAGVLRVREFWHVARCHTSMLCHVRIVVDVAWSGVMRLVTYKIHISIWCLVSVGDLRNVQLRAVLPFDMTHF